MHPPQSYSPNYFSLDDILVTQERIPCKFLTDVRGMGKLNPSSEDADLKAGTNLEAPLWLIQPLLERRQPIINADLPKVYTELYREIFKADATVIDMRKFNVYYYELGQYIKKLDPLGEVAEILNNSFKVRLKQLIDLSNHAISDPTVVDKLDFLEKTLFSVGHDAKVKLDEWLLVSDRRLGAADMVVNHKKRRRIDIEDLI